MSDRGPSDPACTETQGEGFDAGQTRVAAPASDDEELAAGTGSQTGAVGAEPVVATDGALLTPRLVVWKPAKTSPYKNELWNVLTLSS